MRVDPASFRDPAGYVFERDGILYRQVNRWFEDRFERFVTSGLLDRLVGGGLLVSHVEVDRSLAATDEASRVLQPHLIPFISYPYEWCFGQLRDAALLTLAAQRTAMDAGFTLRDASAFNVQFDEGKPVLIDTLSFEPMTEGEPWPAYGQFCRHFLAPLALMSYRDLRLGALTRLYVDGIPLDLAARLLPGRARLRPSLLLHLFAHARGQRRVPGDPRRSRGFSERAFRGLVEGLEGAVHRLRPHEMGSAWTGYDAEGATYPPEARADKERLVEAMIERAGPASVVDLGANTGRFSRLAAERGAWVVALDRDPAAVEAAYGEHDRVLPLVMDLLNPSPSLGWGGRERMSLEERGAFDLSLALALVHHLAIAGNVPLDQLAHRLRTLADWSVVEMVPKSDPQVERMLAVREDVFPDYTEAGFEEAFGRQFEIVSRERVAGSERTLYLLRGL